MEIPTIESRASNILMTTGITYVDIAVRPIKIFVEYVGTNMGIEGEEGRSQEGAAHPSPS